MKGQVPHLARMGRTALRIQDLQHGGDAYGDVYDDVEDGGGRGCFAGGSVDPSGGGFDDLFVDGLRCAGVCDFYRTRIASRYDDGVFVVVAEVIGVFDADGGVF